MLACGNVVVIEAPGPYDIILVLKYTGGRVHIAFSDSTHDEVQPRSSTNGIMVTLTNTQTGKKTMRMFQAN